MYEEKMKDEIVNQLAGINEQLEIRNRCSNRIWTTVGVVLIVFLLCNILLAAVGTAAYKCMEVTQESVTIEEQVEFMEGEP